MNKANKDRLIIAINEIEQLKRLVVESHGRLEPYGTIAKLENINLLIKTAKNYIKDSEYLPKKYGEVRI